MGLRLLLCASLFVVACQGVPTSAGASASANASARVASADPSRLPTPDQERAVTAALATAGIQDTSVIPSKFDWLFGTGAPRSGSFSGTLDGTQIWADVHFLEVTTKGITACAGRSASGESVFTVSLKGRPEVLGGAGVTGALSGAGPMYFASSDRLFVMTPDARLRDALVLTLVLSVPSCIWREPQTLPVFPWEREVMDAFAAEGIGIRVIGGSKFESFLGDRRDARVFIGASGQTGTGRGRAVACGPAARSPDVLLAIVARLHEVVGHRRRQTTARHGR